METSSPSKSELPLVLINSKTWNRDSHGLYDYEANNTKNNLSISQGDAMYIRKRNDVREGSTEEADCFLFDLKASLKKCFLSNKVDSNMQVNVSNINSLQNKIWFVVPSEEKLNQQNQQNPLAIVNSNSDYFINPNDIIKLGRVKYSVNKINIGDEDVERVTEQEPVFDFIYKSL